MSGSSYESTCPNCGESIDVYTDWKPFDYSTLTCAHCGLQIYPKVEYMTLEELNAYRNEQNEYYDFDKLRFPTLTELPIQREIW